MNLKLKECLETQARPYLRKMGVEQGGLVTKDFQFIPFENISEDPQGEIRMGEEGFKKLAQLQLEDNLHAWVHSHAGRPNPSVKDIVRHSWPILMVIYSIQEDRFVSYTSEQLTQAAAGLTNGSHR